MLFKDKHIFLCRLKLQSELNFFRCILKHK